MPRGVGVYRALVVVVCASTVSIRRLLGSLAFPNHRCLIHRRGLFISLLLRTCTTLERAAPIATVVASLRDASYLYRPGLPGTFHRIVQRTRPSIDIPCGVLSHTPCDVLRPRAARHAAWAVFVVLPHLDGFLLHRLRGLVAFRSRPWGSSCFHPAPSLAAWARGFSRRCIHPPEPSPHVQPFLRHRSSFPPRRLRDCVPLDLEALLHP